MTDQTELTKQQNSPSGLNDGLGCRIDYIFKEVGKPMSPSDIAKELYKRKWMPKLCSVLDIADFMHEWYGSKRTF